MKSIAYALGCLVSVGLTAPAIAADVQAQDPASVVSAMQEAGYRAQLTTDDVGDPLIRSSSGGTDFLVLFYNCTDNTDCRTIQFYVGFSEPNSATIQSMNTWNKDNRFGRAYYDDGIARLEMDLDLDDGGVSRALFEDNLEYWALVMSKFEDYVSS